MGGLPEGGVSAQGEGGVCTGGVSTRGCLSREHVCPGVSAQGVFLGGVCLRVSAQRGVSAQGRRGCLPRGVSTGGGGVCQTPPL